MQSNHIMVIIIVAMVMIAGVFKSKYRGSRKDRLVDSDGHARIDSAETARLRDEVKQLKDRLIVLERITVEKENSLEREIEALRDR
jgi:uncharacterized protein YlxW (UPF0749 family)